MAIDRLARRTLIKPIPVTNALSKPATQLVALTIAFLAFSCLATAQLYTGSIAGTVTDPSGAVISDAQIKAVDQ
jgi:hypothetical protein